MNTLSTDLRAIKTRAAIQSHFIDLLLEKNFNEITVKDIARAANIGRGTFYLHYTDKFDLLGKLMDEGLKSATDNFQPKAYFKEGKVLPERLVGYALKMFDHFQEHERFYRAMLFNEGISSFRYRMQQSYLKKFRHEIQELSQANRMSDPITMEILPIFISSGMIGLVGWWFKNNMRISKEYMARKVFQVMTKGPLQVLGFAIDEEGEDELRKK
ncbi:TetR/AcrR family transcriptional regulator [Sporolactobacillus putidus]|uniref:TetR family transcriptional regulator n=1 Tax=Sporolactobacillus putidus TaxID=492735 RepID=A0A917S106_9BACL|nr:TetR/AcrR family transcriptional regulator [Sporolactobacillus putidus]GGL49509.1 TetR family transcriptional regulator [Sporolactobacillus putidus]